VDQIFSKTAFEFNFLFKLTLAPGAAIRRKRDVMYVGDGNRYKRDCVAEMNDEYTHSWPDG
jgi:hypothetical protein